MKIVIISGSPKGEQSITLQYVKYLKHCFKDVDFIYHHVAFKMGSYLKEETLDCFFNDIKNSDGVIWAFPLYFAMVHSSYKRFIETILSHKDKDLLNGKYAASISTSIKYFDHTAHNYIQGISEDLGMTFFDFFSAKMNDLTTEENRTQLENFGRMFFSSIDNKSTFPKVYAKVIQNRWEYKPSQTSLEIQTDKTITVLTDNNSGNIGSMVKFYSNQFVQNISVYNINDIDIKGSCLGCIKCGEKNVCAYNNTDGFYDFYNNVLIKSDVIVYAGELTDRYLSWQWKRFFDRHFVYTHRPMLKDKSFIYIVSGALSSNENIREIFRGFVENQGGNLLNIMSDEYNDSSTLDHVLESIATRTIEALNLNYSSPKTFLGIGGQKIFRDDIYSFLRVVFKADYKDYKKHNKYDFAHKSPLKLLGIRLLYIFTKIPFVRDQLYKEMVPAMLFPIHGVFKKLNVEH